MRAPLLRLAAAALLAVAGTLASAAPLTLEVYNPGAASMFPVSSEIVSGAHDAVLVDAQFQRNDAQALVRRLKAGGKRLTTIYVSHSDPDYYFGLDVIHAAFPHARIVATAPTVAAIRLLKDRKKAFWGPLLKANAPRTLLVPEVLQGDRIALEGESLQVVGLDGPTPARTFVWIPSLQAVVGGAVLFSGTHVWIADTPNPAALASWQATLATLAALQPARVVPGHCLGEMPAGLGAVTFTAGYLATFQQAAAGADGSAPLVAAMEQAYPGLAHVDWLALGAQVFKGETTWPK